MKDIIEKVKALPPGRLVLHLDADGWSLPPFCNTDDLHSLVEHIEKLEAMLEVARSINFPGELNMGDELVQLSTGWRFLIGDGKCYPTALEAYEVRKESQP